MKKILFGILVLSSPLMAGRWSGEVEYFPSATLQTGENHRQFRLDAIDPYSNSATAVSGHYHNDLAFRVGAHYQTGPLDFAAKYLLGQGSLHTGSGPNSSTLYQSATASADLGGWLWRIYLGGRVLARYTGFSQELDVAHGFDRKRLDAVGAGAGLLARLRILGGLAVGAELDLLVNQLRLDGRREGIARKDPVYQRTQPGADAQLFIEYAYRGKKFGGKIRLGSYAEGIVTGDWSVNDIDLVYTNEQGLFFGGLFANLSLGF